MGSNDDLEEFDAELEIALKREYTDVFGLFTFCVITQEATYLCNKIQVDFAPTPGYLLFELRMEDVWVWDRNRPTRIIPRAQVFTTSDVTNEQLKESAEGGQSEAIPPDVIERLRQVAADDVIFEEDGPATSTPGGESDSGPDVTPEF
jgi:hypothetical protein